MPAARKPIVIKKNYCTGPRLEGGGLRGEVVIPEDHLVIIIAVVFGEEPFLAQEVVRFQNEALPDLQREDVLLRVCRDYPHTVLLACRDYFSTRVESEDFLQPLLTRELTLLGFRNICHDRKLLRASREHHLADVAGATFPLLLRRVRLFIHCLHTLQGELGVAIRFGHRGAEELQATHVSCTLDLDTPLAALLEHLLEQLRRVLCRWRCIRCGLLGGLIGLLLCLLEILLVELDLLQGVGLCLHSRDTTDAPQSR